MKNIETAIEITETHVKFLQSQVLRGKNVVSTCDVRALQNFTDEELTRVLTDIVRSKNIYPDKLVLAIPRRLSILKQLRLPSQNEDEITKMIRLQLVNQIPYNLEDVIFDYQLIEKEAGGYAKVLVVIVHKDVSHRFLKIFDKVGISLGRLTLSSFGVLGWFIFQQSQRRLQPTEPVMIVNVDIGHSEICFCLGDKLLFSRSITHGVKDLMQDNILGILSQAELSVGTYRKENMGPELKRCYLVSALADLSRLKESLEQKLQITTENAWLPTENILTRKNVSLASLRDQPGLSLAAASGSLLSDFKKSVNLLPAKVHEDKISKLRKRQIAVFVLLIALNVLLGFSILGIDLYRKTEAFNALEAQIEQSKVSAEKAKKILDFVAEAKKQFEERVFIPDLIRSLFQLTPKDISYRSLELDDNGFFTIQGYAQTSGGVSTLQTNMVNSSVFSEINLQFATQRRIFNMDVTDFKIVCKLKK